MRMDLIVEGFRHNEKADFCPRKLRVLVTKDSIGTTLSVQDPKDGTMFTIPLDAIIKEINRGSKR